MEIVAPQPAFTVERYFALVDEGVLEPVVVSGASHSPHGAAAAARATYALTVAVGRHAVVRPRLPGRYDDYDHAHPRSALLVVEVSDSSLKMDRLTKAMVYAAAGVPEYWIVNVRAGQVEVHRDPDPAARRYGEIAIVGRDGRIAPVAFPDLSVAADDLLPRPAA